MGSTMGFYKLHALGHSGIEIELVGLSLTACVLPKALQLRHGLRALNQRPGSLGRHQSRWFNRQAEQGQNARPGLGWRQMVGMLPSPWGAESVLQASRTMHSAIQDFSFASHYLPPLVQSHTLMF